jgi:hypothetical protein
VSLLEVNTFAHCVSTLLIYIFWWVKPYDVETHTIIESNPLDFSYSLEHNRTPVIPALVLPHGSDIPKRFTISDFDGNRLMNNKVIPFTLSMLSREHPVCQTTESIQNIPNTGLCISFEHSSGIPISGCHLKYRPEEEHQWQRFWNGWVGDNQPVPAHPLPVEFPCFYSRAIGSPDLDAGLLRRIQFADYSLMMLFVMTSAFIVYGVLHLLAWQYNFNSATERYLWRVSAVITASSGFVLFALHTAEELSEILRSWPTPRPMWVVCVRNVRIRMRKALTWLSYLLVPLNVASRAFLVTESFIAFSNSPRPTYTIPSWTSYMPHI